MRKYQIGYTTGVFDMFHIGHLAILRHAKEQCDYLIVGVSSDELVQEYKKKKPIIGLHDRMEIVGAIKYVDKVVVQETLDKFDAWQNYKFNVLFHGDDWKNTTIYDNIIVKLKKVGVDVIFLPHTPGISTSILTEVVRSKNSDE